MSKNSQTTVKRGAKILPASDSSLLERSKVEPEEFAPAEWDFREIHPRQLGAAIFYEYGRSCEWVLKVFDQWHKTAYQPPSNCAVHRKWAGRTIVEIRNTPEDEILPGEVEKWFFESMPSEFKSHGLEKLLEISPLFPKPFLELVFPATLQIPVPRYQDCAACWESTGKGGVLFSRWIQGLEDEPAFLRQVSVDLRFSKGKILKDFQAWLKKLDDSRVDKFKMGRGKEASLPWHRLKELAAYRLAKFTHIKYSNARGFVRNIGKHPALPDYSAGGFSDAVRSAENYIQTLFPNPIRL